MKDEDDQPLKLSYNTTEAVDGKSNSTSASTSSPSKNNPSPTTSDAASSNNQASNNTGLDGGTKAGIAVGAVIGMLLIVALVFLCFRRHKSKHKTAGGFYGDAPGSSNDLREKEAGVGIAAIPVLSFPTSHGDHAHNGDPAVLGRGSSGRVVDGAGLEREDVGGHAAPIAGVGAAGVARKPLGSRGLSNEESVGRDGAISSQSQVLSDEERAR